MSVWVGAAGLEDWDRVVYVVESGLRVGVWVGMRWFICEGGEGGGVGDIVLIVERFLG